MDVKVQDQKMLIRFFDIRGNIPFEFVSKGTTDNLTPYAEVLKRLFKAMRGK
jgi:hypothetical protein